MYQLSWHGCDLGIENNFIHVERVWHINYGTIDQKYHHFHKLREVVFQTKKKTHMHAHIRARVHTFTNKRIKCHIISPWEY